MKTHTLIAGTALLGMAIGFIAGNEYADRGAAARNEAAEVSPRTKSTKRGDGPAESAGKVGNLASEFPKGSDYKKMSAADALAMVKANGDSWVGEDPLEMARQIYEYQLMVRKLPLEELEKLIMLSKEAGVPISRTRQLFGAYVARDLNKAMAWAATQPDADSWKVSAVGALAASDPGRALEMYQDVILNGPSSPYGGADGGFWLASSIAKQGTVAFFQFLDSVPSAGAGNYISNSARLLPKEDVPGFMAELEKRVKDGKLDQATVSRTMQTLAFTDPELTRSIIAKMEPGLERAKRELGFAGALVQQGNTAEAVELAKSAMAQQPGKEKEFLIAESQDLLLCNSPELIDEVVAALPQGSELNVEDVKKMSDRMWRADLVTMAKLLKSPGDQARYLEGAIESLGKRGSKLNEADFRVLEHRLQSLGLTGMNLKIVQKELAFGREMALGSK